MNSIVFGDCRETMRKWAAEGVKVQTCVTSPPYFGLRDYGHEGQIGLEQTPEEYIKAMVDVFRCVWDVLADDGTLWLNIGDSYNKEKNLIGIPWMLAFALRADGWYLRQDIIWHKPNPMPESVTDRCTKAHEYIFLLSKLQKYFFDSDAMREPCSNDMQRRAAAGHTRGQGKIDKSRNDAETVRPKQITAESRNRRSVWTVNTKPYKGAHFATFPPALIEPCILAGTSEKGHCPQCGFRWVRKIERSKPPHVEKSNLDRFGNGEAGVHRKVGQAYQNWLNENPARTVGWEPTCKCECEAVPDIVLDPFMGSGTTAAVSLQHGRQYLGCELNQEYEALQQQRISDASKGVSQLVMFD
jgi:DNA modification methylase